MATRPAPAPLRAPIYTAPAVRTLTPTPAPAPRPVTVNPFASAVVAPRAVAQPAAQPVMPTLNQNVSTILQQQQAARDAAAQRQQQLQALQAAQAQAAAQQVAAGQANRAQVEAAQQASYQASVTAAAQQDAARLAAQQAAQAAAAPRAMPQPVFTLPTPVPTAPAPQTSMQAVTNPAAMQQPIQQTPTQQPNQIIAPGVGFTLGIQGPGGSGIYDSRTGYTPGTGLEPAPMYAPDGSLIGYSMPAQAQGNQPTPQPNTGIMALAPQMNSMQPPTVTGMSKGI